MRRGEEAKTRRGRANVVKLHVLNNKGFEKTLCLQHIEGLESSKTQSFKTQFDKTTCISIHFKIGILLNCMRLKAALACNYVFSSVAMFENV